jgi:polyisoprenoid-binding protein YceI
MAEPAATQEVRYALDARGSRLTVQAFASGLLSAMGHDPVMGARTLSGEIAFAPDIPNAGALRLRVDARSLTVQDGVNERDRREIERTMHESVLETATYGEIVYDATARRVERIGDGRYRVDADGPFSLHGVTKNQRVSAQVFVMGDTLRAQGEVLLRQTDYGITLVSVAGGALKIKDEVKCVFDLLARKAT